MSSQVVKPCFVGGRGAWACEVYEEVHGGDRARRLTYASSEEAVHCLNVGLVVPLVRQKDSHPKDKSGT